MVRAKLGKNIENMQDIVSDIHFTSQPALRGIGGTSVAGSQAQVYSIGNFGIMADVDGGEERHSVLVNEKKTTVAV